MRFGLIAWQHLAPLVLSYDATDPYVHPIVCVCDLCGGADINCSPENFQFPPCTEDNYVCGYQGEGQQFCPLDVSVEQYVSKKHYRLSSAVGLNT